MHVSRSLLTPCVLALAGLAAASDDPGEMVTDRPDQTESSSVVAPKHVQIETGLTHTHADDSRQLEVPTTLLRVGVIERLELRIGLPAYGREFAGDDTDGVTDTEIGAKVYLFAEQGARPEAALLFGTTLPTGGGAFTSHRADPSFRFSFSHTLTERIGLGYNAGMAWNSLKSTSGDKNTFTDLQYTLAAGFSITDRLGAFVELFGDVPLSGPNGDAHSLDGGFTYVLRENLQLDAAVGVGLNDDADDWFVTAGVSVRLPR